MGHLAQSEECATLDLRVMRSSPMLGIEMAEKNSEEKKRHDRVANLEVKLSINFDF